MPKKPAATPPATVEDAVRRDLAEIAASDPRLAESGLALSTLALAKAIDSGGTSSTAKSMCARELREALDRLRELTPPKAEGDRLDELSARRDQRRATA